MVMSRKRRNLLSKKRKNSKRNTKRSTKTRKNMRKMRGGAPKPKEPDAYYDSLGRFDKWLNAENSYMKNSKNGEDEEILEFHPEDYFFEGIPNQKVLNRITYLINHRVFQTTDEKDLQEGQCVTVTTNKQNIITPGSDIISDDKTFKRLNNNSRSMPVKVYKIDEITTLNEDTDRMESRYRTMSGVGIHLPCLILRDINSPNSTGFHINYNNRKKYNFTLYEGDCPELDLRPHQEEEKRERLT